MSLGIIAGSWKNANKNTSIAQYATSRVVQSVAVEGLYIGGKQPDTLLGFLPLYAVQYLEVGRSQDILQYRAVGAEFLAQQQGGNLGMRIDIMLQGSTAPLILGILNAMTLYSREDSEYDEKTSQQSLNEQKVDNTTNGIINQNPFTARGPTSVLKSNYSSIVGVTPEISMFTTKPGDYLQVEDDYKIDSVADLKDADEEHLKVANDKNTHITVPDDLTWAKSVYHRTFPVVTRDELLFDMYIETLVYRRTTKKGSKVIYCTILLRQFTPPDVVVETHLQGYKNGKSQGKKNADLEAKDYSNIRTGRIVTTTPRVKSASIKKFQITPEKIDFMLSSLHRIGWSLYRYGNKYDRLKRRNIRDPGYIYRNVVGACGTVFKPTKAAEVSGF